MSNGKVLINKVVCLFVVISVLVFAIGGALTATSPYNKTVLGNANLFVKGTAWPTNIQIAGYDTLTNTIYLDFSLTKDSATVTKFNYVVDIFSADNTGSTSRINANTTDGGTVDSPIALNLSTAANTGSVANKSLVLNGALTNAHRIVITVVSTQ